MLLFIFLMLIGALMLIKPNILWMITERWKSNDATDPSDLYLISTRFGGALCFIIGLAGMIALRFV
ncbi:DUF6199 family natural product biosynthesis protein [Cohnella sp.]|uniref:DUF6199 family natural product biosynthesis protein n=1 Tax=Cohnella sp. TaxID=1883426 RepID=UPI0035616002